MAMERVLILNYVALGKKVAEWATDETANKESWPKDANDLRKQVMDMAMIPERINEIQVIQPDMHQYILRLPPKALLEESIAINTADPGGAYTVANFYYDRVHPQGPGISNIDYLYSRVGDYTFAGCK